jgi:hypothetical protein
MIDFDLKELSWNVVTPPTSTFDSSTGDTSIFAFRISFSPFRVITRS